MAFESALVGITPGQVCYAEVFGWRISGRGDG
jgi:hypothetical protein